jgi:hypothetical protein
MKSKINLKTATITLIQDNSKATNLWETRAKVWKVEIDDSIVGHIYKRKIKKGSEYKTSYAFMLGLFDAFRSDASYVTGKEKAELKTPYQQAGWPSFETVKVEFYRALLLNLYKILQ